MTIKSIPAYLVNSYWLVIEELRKFVAEDPVELVFFQLNDIRKRRRKIDSFGSCEDLKETLRGPFRLELGHKVANKSVMLAPEV